MDPVESLRFLYQGTVPFAECIYMMGITVLSEHLQTAAKFLINGTSKQNGYWHKYSSRGRTSSASPDDIQESLAFVQGTGLNLVIEEYGLEVDPEELREGFFNFCQYRKRIKKSKSL